MADNNIDEVYSHLRIDKKLRRGFIFSVCVVGFLIFVVAYTALFQDQHWSVIAISSSLLGAFLVFYPQTEEWVYKPWQRSPQTLEKNQ